MQVTWLNLNTQSIGVDKTDLDEIGIMTDRLYLHRSVNDPRGSASGISDLPCHVTRVSPSRHV